MSNLPTRLPYIQSSILLALCIVLALNPDPALAQGLDGEIEQFKCKVLEIYGWIQLASGAAALIAFAFIAFSSLTGKFNWRFTWVVFGAMGVMALAPHIVDLLYPDYDSGCNSTFLDGLFG